MTTRKHIVIDARIRRSSTGRYIDRLIQHLQQIDSFHHYTVLTEPDDPWRPMASNFHRLPCPYAQFSFNPLQQLGFAWQLYKLNADLVHFSMTQQPLLYFGHIVTTTHDLTMMRFTRRGTTRAPLFALKMASYRFLLKWSHRKSAKIIVPTKFVADDLTAYQPSIERKLVVTYEASEPPLAQAAKQPERVTEHDQFILYVGTAFPHKNLRKLLDAFDILHSQLPDLKLVLVGKKEIHYEELEQDMQHHSAASHVIATGFLPDEQLKWLYEHCRAYVFPSLSEGFGLPGLEAMAHHVAVVSSSASCLPEVYAAAAYYFDPTNPEDIAVKVHDVLEDVDLRKRLIQNGDKQIQRYSWRKMAEETLIVYKEVLREN